VKLNDEVRTFDTIEEAETEAALLNKEMNRNSAGYFRYWVEEKCDGNQVIHHSF
jgi:hypothetical protein